MSGGGFIVATMTVWVDADACPTGVLEIVRRHCGVRGIPVTTVSTWRHEFSGERHVTVDAAPQATDLAILARMGRGDVVVTQDYGLAALALARGGHGIAPGGMRFTADNIDALLAARAHAEKLRTSSRRGRAERPGRAPRGPAPRTRADDERFSIEFARLLDLVDR